MNAVNPIDKFIAAKRVQRTLRANPNDIDALEKLAAMLIKEPELKRGVLNRILSLDPVNKTAREMLLEMDRAEMGGGHSQTVAPAISTAQHSAPVSTRSSNDQLEKPLVSRYSIIHQILIYPLILFSILFMFQALGDWDAFIFFTGFFLLLLIPVWFVSAVVEVSNSGIKLTRLFGMYCREVAWTEINRIEPAIMGVGMKLTTIEGISVTISSQMYGYSTIVEILRRMRPDLFDTAGVKIFRKGLFAKYGLFFFLIPATPLALGAVLAPPFLPGIVLAVLIFFFWRSALHTVHLAKVEENRLSTQSFRKNQELTGQQIKNISMMSLRNRRGVAKNFICIELHEGDEYRLSGFPEGNEIMYGFLRNWWDAHQTS